MSGKLGIYVFMRRKGEQVTRSLVKPTDAKTTAQGRQRSALSNIVRLYQSSPAFFKNAFANKASNQSDYNALVSRNLGKTIAIYLPKRVASEGGGVVAPYVISDGGLQPIIVSGIGVNAYTNIALGTGFSINDTTTVAVLTQAILANNTFLQEGDQISYLSIEQYTANGVPRLRARKYELVLSNADSTPARDYIPQAGLSVVNGWLGHGDYVYSGAFAWVLSRNTKDKLDVSRQSLIVTSDELYSSYTGMTAAVTAANSYRNNKEVFLSPLSVSMGTAMNPTVAASVATVSINGKQLSVGGDEFDLSPTGTIAAGKLVITGSGFDGIESISLAVSGSDTADSFVTVPVTVSGDTSMTNTDAITLAGVTSVESVNIRIEGATVYSWHGTPDSGEGPLG